MLAKDVASFNGNGLRPRHAAPRKEAKATQEPDRVVGVARATIQRPFPTTAAQTVAVVANPRPARRALRESTAGGTPSTSPSPAPLVARNSKWRSSRRGGRRSASSRRRRLGQHEPGDVHRSRLRRRASRLPGRGQSACCTLLENGLMALATVTGASDSRRGGHRRCTATTSCSGRTATRSAFGDMRRVAAEGFSASRGGCGPSRPAICRAATPPTGRSSRHERAFDLRP